VGISKEGVQEESLEISLKNPNGFGSSCRGGDRDAREKKPF